MSQPDSYRFSQKMGANPRVPMQRDDTVDIIHDVTIQTHDGFLACDMTITTDFDSDSLRKLFVRQGICADTNAALTLFQEFVKKNFFPRIKTAVKSQVVIAGTEMLRQLRERKHALVPQFSLFRSKKEQKADKDAFDRVMRLVANDVARALKEIAIAPYQANFTGGYKEFLDYLEKIRSKQEAQICAEEKKRTDDLAAQLKRACEVLQGSGVTLKMLEVISDDNKIALAIAKVKENFEAAYKGDHELGAKCYCGDYDDERRHYHYADCIWDGKDFQAFVTAETY